MQDTNTTKCGTTHTVPQVGVQCTHMTCTQALLYRELAQNANAYGCAAHGTSSIRRSSYMLCHMMNAVGLIGGGATAAAIATQAATTTAITHMSHRTSITPGEGDAALSNTATLKAEGDAALSNTQTQTGHVSWQQAARQTTGQRYDTHQPDALIFQCSSKLPAAEHMSR